MMMSLGHEVYHYGGQDSTVECTEHITVITKEQQVKWWGSNDWRKEFFAIEWDSNIDYWRESNSNSIREIKKRIQPKDFICLIGGNCQKPIADAFPVNMAVEFGIGYHGVFSKYRVFESYAWMHHIYGELKQGDGSWYDAVIPNYFDPADFPLVGQKEDYFLYVGRLVMRKGLEVAVRTTEKLGKKLLIAGQGVIRTEPGMIVAKELTLKGDHIEHIGVLDVEKRGKLMGGAKALFAPTYYIGPFEGVSIEALFCGTPVITTDWGCFSENNIDGRTGFRVRTLGESVWAANNLDRLWHPKMLRSYAEDRFSIDVVKYRYQDYFEQLARLWGDGWYTMDYQPTKRDFGGFRYNEKLY